MRLCACVCAGVITDYSESTGVPLNIEEEVLSRSVTWQYAFADALIGLRPDMNPDAAEELSDSALMELSDLPPSDAAALWARHESVSTFVQAADHLKRGKRRTVPF